MTTSTKGVTPPSEKTIVRRWASAVASADLCPDARCEPCGSDGGEHGLALWHRVGLPGEVVCLECARERWGI